MSADPAALTDSVRSNAPLGPDARRPPVPPAPYLRLAWDAEAASDASAEPVEDRLARLARAVGPLRRVLAAIAGRLIATKAYERLCYARLGDYARERPGLSARQLQELARVDLALAGLPALERALVANELPWSKLRLLVRVAAAEDEQSWLTRARALPVRRLEQEVRERTPAGSPEEPDDAEPAVRVTLRCSPAVCEKWTLARETAELVAGQRLRASEAFELLVAEVFSATSIDPARVEAMDEPPGPRRDSATDALGSSRPGEPAPLARAPGRDLPRAISSLATGLDAADAFELDRRLRLAVQLEQTLDATLAPLLRHVRSLEYEWRSDWCTLSHYAREQLGISPSKARALLRLERAGDVCPELRSAYRSGRLSWVKAQCLLPLLLLDLPGEWRPAWVSWAERVTVRRLERDVERALLLRAGHDRAWQRCKAHPERAQDPIPAEERQLCAHDVDLDATQQLTWHLPRAVAVLFLTVRETLRSRLGPERGRPLTDGEAFEALLDCALAAWALRDPSARRPDPVIERDGYRCAVPGCTSRRSLHDHHVVFRSAQGSDSPHNRITLCAFHHLRCLHAGLLSVRGRAPDGLEFELGLRTGASPLARYRSGDIVIPTHEPRPAAATR